MIRITSRPLRVVILTLASVGVVAAGAIWVLNRPARHVTSMQAAQTLAGSMGLDWHDLDGLEPDRAPLALAEVCRAAVADGHAWVDDFVPDTVPPALERLVATAAALDDIGHDPVAVAGMTVLEAHNVRETAKRINHFALEVAADRAVPDDALAELADWCDTL
jgi:hypothetical protein